MTKKNVTNRSSELLTTAIEALTQLRDSFAFDDGREKRVSNPKRVVASKRVKANRGRAEYFTSVRRAASHKSEWWVTKGRKLMVESAREFREVIGVSNYQMAKAMNIRSSYFENLLYDNGKSNKSPSLDIIRKMEDYFGIDKSQTYKQLESNDARYLPGFHKRSKKPDRKRKSCDWYHGKDLGDTRMKYNWDAITEGGTSNKAMVWVFKDVDASVAAYQRATASVRRQTEISGDVWHAIRRGRIVMVVHNDFYEKFEAALITALEADLLHMIPDSIISKMLKVKRVAKPFILGVYKNPLLTSGKNEAHDGKQPHYV